MARERGAANDNYSGLPPWLSGAVKSVLLLPRRVTVANRMLPTFLIIGAQRAGTTSLHRYLMEHPQVVPPWPSKGVHHFDLEPQRSRDWYRAHFARAAPGRITGESSPYYLFHPLAASRVAAALPEVRVIAMLRDPVLRAHSQYQQEYARGFERCESFERALELEPGRLEGEEQRLLADPTARSHAHQHHSYVARGMYLEQLLRWQTAIGAERMLVLIAEEFFADPAGAYRSVLRFLGLSTDPVEPVFRAHNARGYGALPEPLSRALAERFEQPNRALEQHLGRRLGWTQAEAVGR